MQTYPVSYLHLKDPYILWFSEYSHSILIFGSIGTLPQISFWCCTHPKICISWGWMCFRRKIRVSFSWKELLKHFQQHSCTYHSLEKNYWNICSKILVSLLLKRIIETFAVRKSEKYAAAFNHSRAEFETFQFFIFRKKGRIHYFQCKILATVPMPSSGIINPLFMLVSMFQNIGIIASFTKYQ